MERYLDLIITEKNIEKNIEQILLHQAHLTRRQISQAKFRTDGIQKNGIQCRVNESVLPGDHIRVCLENNSAVSGQLLPSETAVSLDILYEDADVIAVNKPAGILTHPSGVHYDDTLSNQLVRYFQEKKEHTMIRPVGRLDKETSGIVLFAKNRIAAARLQKQREDHLFCKQYVAAAKGFLPVDEINVWHTISYPLVKTADHPIKMKAVIQETADCGKNTVRYSELLSAITHYQVLKSTDSYSLVTICPETGRTHQIRVHMKAIGHPLLGDRLYGTPSISGVTLFNRAALHAWKITFNQPFTGEKISLEAALPEDFSYFSG